MNERPTEPYGRPSEPAGPADRPAAPEPAAPEPADPPTPSVVTPGSPSDAALGGLDPIATSEPAPAAADVPVAASVPASDRPAVVAATAAYSPPPERLDRDRLTWETPVQPTPEAWFEPVAGRSRPPAAPAPRRSGGILGPVAGRRAPVAAVLAVRRRPTASLRASGALDRPAPVAGTPDRARPTSLTHAGHDRRVVGDHRRRGQGQPGRRPDLQHRRTPTSTTRTRSPRRASGRGSSSTPTAGSSRTATSWPAATSSSSSSRTVASSTGTIYGIDTLTDLAIVKVDATGPADGVDRRLVEAQGRPDDDRHRQPARAPTRARSRAASCRRPAGASTSTAARSTTSSRPTRRSTRATAAGRSSTPGGNVIGINTAIAANANGIGFAIPINIARPIMEQALAGEKLVRPYIGIRYEMLDRQAGQGAQR